MDAATARADILQNIFIVTVESLGEQENFIERAINNLELDLLDARQVPEQLRGATTETARAIWQFRMNPTSAGDQSVRDAFERWETVYLQAIGESAIDTHMDIENARCLTEADYYSAPPLPFVSRLHGNKGTQN